MNGVGVAAAASGSGSGPMETDEQVAQEIPKTQKELEQEKKDLELAELLDMMDEWKPIVRSSSPSFPFPSNGASCCVRRCRKAET